MARVLHLLFAIGLIGGLAPAHLPERAVPIVPGLERPHPRAASLGADEGSVRKAGLLVEIDHRVAGWR